MPRRKKTETPVKPPETLSEWMREGFKTYGNTHHEYFDPTDNTTCPIGAACLAKKPELRDAELDIWTWADASREVFPELSKQVWITPDTVPEYFRDKETHRIDRSTEGRSTLLRAMITWLNDELELPREETAAIVQRIGY
jgi:hypothetical protein